MSRFARAIFALSLMMPIVLASFIKFACDWLDLGINILVGVFLCFLMIKLLKFYLLRISNQISPEYETFIRISPRKNSTVVFFIIYIVPILFSDKISIYPAVGLAVLLFILLFFVNVIDDNPLLRVMGYRVYDVETSAGLTLMLISKKTPQQLLNRPIAFCTLDDSCILEVNK